MGLAFFQFQGNREAPTPCKGGVYGTCSQDRRMFPSTQRGSRMQELDDVTLARARRGARAALAELISCHGQAVYALVGRMMVKHP